MLTTVCSEASMTQEVAGIIPSLVRDMNIRKWEIKVRNIEEVAISANFLEVNVRVLSQN